MNPYDYNGQAIDFDGMYGFQCFDWANFWSRKLGYQPFTGMYAYEIFGQQASNYNWVANSPTGIPPKGAIVVWDKGINGTAGHVAVATGEGDTNTFVSLDQNWGQPRIIPVRHNYGHVIGWGIPNNQGGGEQVISDVDNEYARWNKLFVELRGREGSRDEFRNAAVGRTWLNAIEILQDSPEADTALQAQQVGQVAVRDNWQGQIETLLAQLKAANDKITELGKKPVDVPPTKVESPSGFTPTKPVITRTWFDKIINLIIEGRYE